MCREAKHECVEGKIVENIRAAVLSGERSPTCTQNVLKKNEMHWDARGGGLGSSTIFKKFNEAYAPS